MLTRTCGFVGLGFASSFGFDSQWPNNNDKTQPDWPDGLAEEFRAGQGKWRQMWKTDAASCQYPGGISDGCPKGYVYSSDWVHCGFSNLMQDDHYRMRNLPSPKPQPELAGPVQTINGLELGIRYAHFCHQAAFTSSNNRIYQAAYISPYHDITQWVFDGQHYLDWVPLESFLAKTEFDLVGNETERKTLVDGMRQLGLRDDGILGQEAGGSTSSPCMRSGTCSSELPEPYSCGVSQPVYPKETGCGRSGGSYCPGSCLDQALYQQQCDNRHCLSSCCHIYEGANETVALSQVWYATTSWQADTLLV